LLSTTAVSIASPLTLNDLLVREIVYTDINYIYTDKSPKCTVRIDNMYFPYKRALGMVP